MENINTELLLAHEFIKEQYQKYLESNSIKCNNERRAYAHAVQVTGNIAHNYNITPKKTAKKTTKTQPHKKEEHTELYNMATTD